MNAFSIAIKDLQVFLKDRGAVFMLFLLPFVFIGMFAFISERAASAGEGEAGLPLTVANHDPDGQFTQEFLAALEATGKVQITQEDPARVDELLNLATLRYALVIPEGFSAALAAGEQVSLRLMLHPLHNQSRVMTVERAIVRASREYLVMTYLNWGLKQMAEMQAANPEAESAFSEERIQQLIAAQQAKSKERPLISVVETTLAELSKTEAGEQARPTVGQTMVAGMAVMFVFLAAQNTAMSIFKEKRQGSFRRLLAAPISKAALLGGKMLPNVILGVVQVVVILATGGYLIRLVGVEPLDLSSDPLGLAVVSLAMVLCSASLGILIAAVAKTEGQVGGLSSMGLFLAGFLAGSFIPLFLFPDVLDKLARIVPHYWANQAYYGLMFRGQTLADVWPNVAALLVFTLAFFGIGLWRFKFD